jgi:hypothetical protein
VASGAVLLASLPAVGRAATRAAVVVSPTGPVRGVTPALFGLNGVDTTGPAWSSKKLQAALAGFFGAGVLRYPGGTAANYWSWRDGWFQPGRWPAEPPRRVDDRLSVFNGALQASGAMPVFVLNTVTYEGQVGANANNTAMLRSQLSFLHAAAAEGWPVKMVELGNEIYLKGPFSGRHGEDYMQRFPTAADYASQMNPWIAAIHRAFPGVQVAAVATDANDIHGIAQRRLHWNAGELPLLHGENAVTIHEMLPVSDPTASPDTVLAYPYLHLQKLKAHELRLFGADKLPLWITAFNLDDVTAGHVFRDTWMQGLFVGEQALQLLSIPDVKNLALSSGVGDAKAAIFNGPRGFGSGGPATVPFTLTATGTTVSAIQTALHSATSIQALSFSPEPELGTTGAPSLVGDVLTTSAGPQLLLENLSSQPLSLDLSAFFPGGFTATQTSAPSVQTLVTGPASTTQSTSSGTADLQVGPYAFAKVAAGPGYKTWMAGPALTAMSIAGPRHSA